MLVDLHETPSSLRSMHSPSGCWLIHRTGLLQNDRTERHADLVLT